MLDQLNWPQIISAAALALIPLLGAGALFLLRQWLKIIEADRHKKWVIKAAQGAAWLIDFVADETKTKLDDAVADALREVAAELGEDFKEGDIKIADSAIRKELRRRTR